MTLLHSRVHAFRIRFKGILGPLLVEAIRGFEHVLPVCGLRWVLYPYAFFRALLEPRPPVPPPAAGFGRGPGAWRFWRGPTRLHLNRALEYMPDRLGSARWRQRCRIHGLERLRVARERGVPVMLAFCHCGPFTLTGFWLSAHGSPVTWLSFGSARHRSRTQDYRGRYSRSAAVPTVLYLDQLRDVVRIFSRGGTLLVAIDYPSGRQVDVPVDAGWTFRMATGALRLAARHGAEVIPCNIVEEGAWRFRLELGQPVPREYLTGEPDLLAAGKHLLAESLPVWRRHPEQCHADFLRSFHPVIPERR